MIKKLLTTLTYCLLFYGSTTLAWAETNWQTWISQLKQQAIDDGINDAFFDKIFTGLQPRPQVIHLARTQPEHRLTFMKYRNSRADNYRIKLGRKLFHKYQPLLNNIKKDFAVNPCVVVAIWGMESSYGHYMGNFPVIQSLATLAYNSKRKKFFRKELLMALHILQEGHVDMQHFKGEWAGASGHPQFLPSSWYKYAVDYNQDGYKNIWTNQIDALASIANYLHQHHWKLDQPSAIPVTIPNQLSVDKLEINNKKSINQWRQLGVIVNNPSVDQQLNGKLVRPYGGPDLLTFDNFQAIMSYNHSVYYAATIGYMADSICN